MKIKNQIREIMIHLSKADHQKQKQWLENEYPAIKKKPARKME